MLRVNSKNFIAKQKIEKNGNAITMSKYRVDGLTMEELQPQIEDPMGMADRLNGKMSLARIGKDEGFEVYHVRSLMPRFFSHRSLITTYYFAESNDGH